MSIFTRFHPPNLSDKACAYVARILQKYILGIFIGKTGGDILYSFQIDKNIKVDLISQFVAALKIFGEENLGQIKRIFIEGLDIEMSIHSDQDLIIVAFYRPNMVTDHLDEEAQNVLSVFRNQFQSQLERNIVNQAVYEEFDETMCLFIQKYLTRINVLKENV